MTALYSHDSRSAINGAICYTLVLLPWTRSPLHRLACIQGSQLSPTPPIDNTHLDANGAYTHPKAMNSARCIFPTQSLLLAYLPPCQSFLPQQENFPGLTLTARHAGPGR